ncbi:hypothetical protein QVD17_01583 [Tagetes erecta]|uniref:Uncharacterized protein n=1 Tax=Tagetes erecta TaxID=13708 RepID=A0AAD8P7Z9_TARER|nr:hypothetical protein QVD17_01580 [Tagetes erecta]KAK1435814.1 hypothetical protein QVD17_01583 [Tagetes erecta]
MGSRGIKCVLANTSRKVTSELNALESSPELPTVETFVNKKTTKTEEHIISPSLGLRRTLFNGYKVGCFSSHVLQSTSDPCMHPHC